MLRLQHLIQLENRKLGYQLDKNLLPLNLHNLLWTDSKNKTLQKTQQYNTRDKHLPKLPKVCTTNYQRGFQFQSIKDYEATPVEIRNSSTLSSFVRKLKIRSVVCKLIDRPPQLQLHCISFHLYSGKSPVSPYSYPDNTNSYI